MTYQTRITQLPHDLQEVIHQHLHQSHMKDIMTQLLEYVEPPQFSMRWWELVDASERERWKLLLASNQTLDGIAMTMHYSPH